MTFILPLEWSDVRSASFCSLWQRSTRWGGAFLSSQGSGSIPSTTNQNKKPAFFSMGFQKVEWPDPGFGSLCVEVTIVSASVLSVLATALWPCSCSTTEPHPLPVPYEVTVPLQESLPLSVCYFGGQRGSDYSFWILFVLLLSSVSSQEFFTFVTATRKQEGQGQ